MTLLTKTIKQNFFINHTRRRTFSSKKTILKPIRFLYKACLYGLFSTTLYILYRAYDHNRPINDMVCTMETNLSLTSVEKKRVVILGTGWGAISFLKSLNTKDYEVVIVSPRNYFLFTPLLPSCTVGTVEPRSIIESIRFIAGHKMGNVKYLDSECVSIDPENSIISIISKNTKEQQNKRSIKYDYLVYAVGAETSTFNIKGIKEHSCFLKEIWDAKKIRAKLSDCIEQASSLDDNDKEKQRLLSMVVVGGGPTGIEYAAELSDYLREDLKKWYPKTAKNVKITLIEALPNVLPMFSKNLIDYTMKNFDKNNIKIMTKTIVKEVTNKTIIVKNSVGDDENIEYGLLVWAGGNKPKQLTLDLMHKLKDYQKKPRGLSINDYLLVDGTTNIFALGDATQTRYHNQ